METWINHEEIENPKHRVTFSDLCLTVLGLLFYVADILTDIMLAVWYLQHGHYLFFALTLVPIYIATAIDLLASWFRNELNNKGSRFWFECLLLSMFHLWGIKIICCLLRTEYVAYKSQRVDADMHEKVTKKSIRAAWLKFNEGAYEASLQTLLQPSILRSITEIPQFQLPFVSECGDLEAIIDSLDLPLPMLLSFVMSLCTAVAAMVNWDKAYRLTNGEEVSTMGLVGQYAWLILTGASREFSILMILPMYPYHTVATIFLHVVIGSVYWYYNLSILAQPTHERCIKSILTGIRWFLSPFYLVRWPTLLLGLHIVHFIGNAAATTTWAISASSPYTLSILNCLIFAVGTICCGFYYWRHRKGLIRRSSILMRRISSKPAFQPKIDSLPTESTNLTRSLSGTF
ncbi:hypothetical protein CBL_09222 [Carabus blaptoides fortunei]